MAYYQDALELTKGLGVGKDCAEYRGKYFRRHDPVCMILAKGYKRECRKRGFASANTWLRETANTLRFSERLMCHDSKTKVEDVCAQIIHEITALVGFYRYKSDHKLERVEAIYRVIERRLMRIHLAPHLSIQDIQAEPEKINGCLQRAMDVELLTKQVLRKFDRQLEQFYRRVGLVRAVTQSYVSDATVRKIYRQQKNNREALECMEAVNELGDRLTLAELADKSVSNPIVKVAELNAQIRGVEDYANSCDKSMSGYFLTFTAPSKYHLFRKNGSAIPNSIHASPKEVQAHLCKVWDRIRARIKGRKMEVYGLRVVEPHHDGTPHWHMLVWVESERAEEFLELCRKYAFEEDGDEQGAHEARFDAKRIDPERGSATGYIVKYISKNITGEHIDLDELGIDGKNSAIRVVAWAKLWKIRQFDFFGVPDKGVYRELRRLKEEDYEGFLAELVKAADESNFCEYMKLAGGTNINRKDRPIHVYREVRETRNKYGEEVSFVKGVLFYGSTIVTRLHQWMIERVPKTREIPKNTRIDSGNDAGIKVRVVLGERSGGSGDPRSNTRNEPRFDSGGSGDTREAELGGVDKLPDENRLAFRADSEKWAGNLARNSAFGVLRSEATLKEREA